jgi:Tfp pilus assembly protein PilO
MKFGALRVDWKGEPTLREKLLFGLVALGFIIPCARGLWMPIEDAIAKANQDVKMIETQADTIKKMLDLTAQAAEATPSNTKTVSEGSRAMRILGRQSADRNQEIASTISAFSSRELATHLELQNIAVGKEVNFPNYMAVPLDVALSGGYGALLRYLTSIEKIERPFLVRGIKLTRAAAPPGTIEAQLAVWVYLVGNPEPQK